MLEFLNLRDNSRASTLSSGSQLDSFPVEFPGTREEEESRSDNQEQKDIDGTGEIENRDTKKYSSGWYVVVTELQKPRYGERKYDDAVCEGVT